MKALFLVVAALVVVVRDACVELFEPEGCAMDHLDGPLDGRVVASEMVSR